MARQMKNEDLHVLREKVIAKGIDEKFGYILGAIDAQLILKDERSMFWVNSEDGDFDTIVATQYLGQTHTYVVYSTNEEHIR